MAKLSDLPERDRNRSLRVNNVWRPLGLDEELRVLFQVDGACWGAAGMARTGPDFSARETEFLTAVAPAIATGTRLAVRSEACGWMSAGHPAIVSSVRTGSHARQLPQHGNGRTGSIRSLRAASWS